MIQDTRQDIEDQETYWGFVTSTGYILFQNPEQRSLQYFISHPPPPTSSQTTPHTANIFRLLSALPLPLFVRQPKVDFDIPTLHRHLAQRAIAKINPVDNLQVPITSPGSAETGHDVLGSFGNDNCFDPGARGENAGLTAAGVVGADCVEGHYYGAHFGGE